MKYYLLLLIGLLVGYAVCAIMIAARDDPAPPRRCRDCIHGRPVPEEVRCIFRDNELNCEVLRGVHYDTYPDAVSIVKEDSFCDEFCWGGGKEASL